MCETGRIVGHIGKDQPFFVIIFAKNFIIAEVETIPYTKPETNIPKLSFQFLKLYQKLCNIGNFWDKSYITLVTTAGSNFYTLLFCVVNTTQL